MPDKLVFLHLSDIHFSRKGSRHYDLDQDVRAQLERDAAAIAARIGPARGILLTGDIAFSGRKEDYELAENWLKTLCDIVGCREQDVWCVPGNHDVDRALFEGSLFVRHLHEKLRPTEARFVDQHLGECLADSSGAIELFRSIENYNKFFATKFSCPSGANPLTWQQELPLNDGSTLRIVGANSTLVSDKNDNNAEFRLILGTMQATPTQLPGVTYLFLCHHPPDWLRDYDAVNMSLDARVKIQLFGHKHAQVIEVRNDCLRLVAGAVHPSRNEQNWKPRYNWIRLFVSGTENARVLNVEIFPRVWSEAMPEYVADTAVSGGGESRSVQLSLPTWKLTAIPAAKAPAVAGDAAPAQEPSEQLAPLSENRVKQMDAARTLTYRFLSLPHVLRIEIAHKLGLLEDDDEGLLDAELFSRVLSRASTEKRLERLWDEVEAQHADGKNPGNPYVGK